MGHMALWDGQKTNEAAEIVTLNIRAADDSWAQNMGGDGAQRRAGTCLINCNISLSVREGVDVKLHTKTTLLLLISPLQCGPLDQVKRVEDTISASTNQWEHQTIEFFRSRVTVSTDEAEVWDVHICLHVNYLSQSLWESLLESLWTDPTGISSPNRSCRIWRDTPARTCGGDKYHLDSEHKWRWQLAYIDSTACVSGSFPSHKSTVWTTLLSLQQTDKVD